MTNFGIYYEIAGVSEPSRLLFGIQDDIVIDITVFPLSTQYKYQLYQVMTILGMPKQIYISAQQSAPYPILPPTVLVLDYSDIGIWASYGYIPDLVGETLVICAQRPETRKTIYDNVGGRLELFDPDMDRSDWMPIKEYADMVGGFTAMKLEDVTNMSVKSFYNTFVNRNTNVCLETPAELWP